MEALGGGEGVVEQRLVALALDQLGGLRSAQIGSPIPRIGARRPSTKSCHAGMMRAGLRRSRPVGELDALGVLAEPRAQRSIFSAAIATMIGSPAATRSRMNGAARSTNSRGA